MYSMNVEKLIAEVFNHPILYDQSLSAYKDVMNEQIMFGRKLHYLWTPVIYSYLCCIIKLTTPVCSMKLSCGIREQKCGMINSSSFTTK